MIDNEDLIMEANSISNSLIGLENYIYDRCSSLDSITIDDINGLSGLITSIKTLSEIHAARMIDYSEDSK